MAYELEWLDNSQRALHLTFIGNWGWKDVENCRPKIRIMVADISYEVSLVVDFNTDFWVPGGIDLNLPRFNQYRNPKIKELVIVVANPFLRNIMIIYSKKPGGFGYPVRFAASLSAARKIVDEANV